MKNQKNERGITLVALVVTIVVLLILAGITIMYVMGDNSVFSQASQAGSDTEESAVREAVMLSINANVIPQLYMGGEPTEGWASVFEKGLYNGMTVNKHGTVTATTTTAATGGATTTTITISGYEIKNGKNIYTVEYTNVGDNAGLKVAKKTATT